jgi:hypothetical protein
MGCCGQRRTEWNGLSQNIDESGAVMLRYLERSPILVRGSSTGRHYQFSGTHPVQAVDSRDATALLSTGFFRRQ